MPRYEGPNPGDVQWWIDHLEAPALVVIKCAHGEPRCGKRIGEIKRDGDRTMALRKMVQPERTTPSPRPGWSARTEAELEERIAEREQHVLRRYQSDDGQVEVMKQNRDLPSAVASLEVWPSYFCPEHDEIPADSVDLARFVTEADDTQSITQRTYWLPR